MRRIVFALIATLSAFLLAATAAPVATAQQDITVTPDRTAANPTTERVLPLHDVRWARRGERREGIFFSKGKVVTWKGKKVKLQSARNRNGRWTTVKSDKTTASEGVWDLSFNGKTGRHYRVLIPKANWARATKVYVGKIVAD